MNSTLEDYVRTGRVGNLQLGLSKTQTIDLVGSPSNWAGKTASFSHSHVPIWQDADVWKYYRDAVGIRFGSSGLSVDIIIYPEFAVWTKEPFLKWPFEKWPTISEFCDCLINRNIPFRDLFLGPDENSEYYLLVYSYCLVLSKRYEDHKIVRGSERKIAMMNRVASKEELPRFVTDMAGQ